MKLYNKILLMIGLNFTMQSVQDEVIGLYNEEERELMVCAEERELMVCAEERELMLCAEEIRRIELNLCIVEKEIELMLCAEEREARFAIEDEYRFRQMS